MGAKGEASRNRILDRARELFSQKGYSRVTMRDICEASGLSRGGLYRHYSSTEAIFAAILNREQQEALQALNQARSSEVAPKTMLTVFLRNRLSRLLTEEYAFENAISEFAANSDGGKALLVHRARESMDILEEMILLGCERGEFHCSRPRDTAAGILWLLEGMTKHRGLLPVTPEEIQGQVELITVLLNT